MMKVAASDYDGTLFRQDRIAKSDAEAIKKWREAEHKFGVVSGRDHGMLVPQLQHYGVGYDYLACNNGGIICTADGKVLWEAEIAPDRTYLCHASEGTWVIREAKQWNFPIVNIEESEVGHLPQTIHQFALGFTNPEDAFAASDEVNAKFGDVVHAYPNRCAVDITPKEISKEQAVDHTLKLMGWQDAEIFAIGDEVNDLPMIEAFSGYTVETARDAIKAKARCAYESVGAMLLANL